MALKKAILSYFRFAAKLQLSKNPKAKIIGITGSAGKSSTREAIVAAIGNLLIVKNCDFGNSETGIPLDILGIKPNNYSLIDWLRMILIIPVKLLFNWNRYDIYVIEMGIDSPKSPKNMEYLLKIIKPDIGVFTNISTVHGESYDYLISPTISGATRHQAIKEAIAVEKSKLINSLTSTGFAILNSDSEIILNACKLTQSKVLTFGQNYQSEFLIKKYKTDINRGTIVDIQVDNQTYTITLPNYLLSKAYSYNLAAALAVASALGIPPKQSTSNLNNNFTIPSGRMTLLKGIDGSYIIDSSYNASYESTVDALQLLKQIKSDNKIAVLGDMREVGQSSEYAHKEIIKLAKTITPHILTIGKEFKSLNDTSITSYLTTKDALESLKNLIKHKSIIIFKGSQNNIYLESLIEKILLNPSDSKFLCRQSKYWKKTKNIFFKSN